MLHIDSTAFGSVTINDKTYGQVLIIAEKIIERDAKMLNELFGTTHLIGDWEVEELLSNKPEVIVIGNGQSGVLEVTREVKEKIKSAGVDLKILRTPKAIQEYNKLRSSAIKVNALIHTTC